MDILSMLQQQNLQNHHYLYNLYIQREKAINMYRLVLRNFARPTFCTGKEAVKTVKSQPS